MWKTILRKHQRTDGTEVNILEPVLDRIGEAEVGPADGETAVGTGPATCTWVASLASDIELATESPWETESLLSDTQVDGQIESLCTAA